LPKVVVLGGCGGIGSVAVETLVGTDFFSSIVVAENRYAEACAFADRFGGNVSAVEVDAEHHESLVKVMEGASVVLNCIGPFYRFGPPVLAAAIEAGVDYVDVCDDLDATEKMLAMDDAARQADVRALIGMGNSPGLANVLARFASDMLTTTESVDIYHVHGGEPTEGPAVVKHRIHAMTSDIPVFLDGEFVHVRMLEESGLDLVEQTEFKDIGACPTYPYPHPETITMPLHIEGVRRVANLGFVLPGEYFALTMDMVRLGLADMDPVTVQGRDVAPLEFAVSYILSRRPGILEEAGLTGPLGCLKVVVKGTSDGEPNTYVFSMSSRGAGAGEGTGIPAALGAILMFKGSIERAGVLPPEAVVVPGEMLRLAGSVIKGTGLGEELPLTVERIDGEGRSEAVDLKL
jgi:saccharopine dehydrogenase-like NADP-dependent oxidoreductase